MIFVAAGGVAGRDQARQGGHVRECTEADVCYVLWRGFLIRLWSNTHISCFSHVCTNTFMFIDITRLVHFFVISF